MAGEHSNTL